MTSNLPEKIHFAVYYDSKTGKPAAIDVSKINSSLEVSALVDLANGAKDGTEWWSTFAETAEAAATARKPSHSIGKQIRRAVSADRSPGI